MIDHAYAAAALGKFDVMLKSIRYATESVFWGRDYHTEGLVKIVAALAQASQYHMVIEVLQTISKRDLAYLFSYAFFNEQKTTVAIHEAAHRSNLGRELLSLYNAAGKYLSNTPSTYSIDIPGLHFAAAMFAGEALHDTSTAKLLLSETVYCPRAHFYMVEQAAYLLSELLLENLRLSVDPHAKARALEETRDLQKKPSQKLWARIFASLKLRSRWFWG